MPTFYCYQRCSTCKKAEQWLVEHGVAFDKVDLVATPPAEADLLRWLTANQARGLRYFFNASDGKLIKRPLMVEGEHVTAGFKPAIYEQEWLP